MATEITTTLHPENDPDTNLYPNIKPGNIPNKSIGTDKLDQNVLNLIGSLKPSGTDTSTNILAFTTNKGIYVATDNGHWYYWDGTQYVDGGVYQSGINYSDIIGELKNVLFGNINLFDKTDITSGGYYREGLWIASPTLYSTNFIELQQKYHYYTNSNYNVYIDLYDENYNYIKQELHDFYLDDNRIKYMRCAGTLVNLDSDMVIMGFEYPNDYISYSINRISTFNYYTTLIHNLINNDNRQFTNYINFLNDNSTINVFDKSDIQSGGYYVNGEWIASPTLYATGLIPVIEGEKYINSQYTQRWTYYDKQGNYLFDSELSNTYKTIPNGVGFIRAFGLISNLNNDMLIMGDTYPNNYIPYTNYKDVFNWYIQLKDTIIDNKYRDKKIYTLGDSITWYDGHTNTLQEYVLGYRSYLLSLCDDVTNYGISGACGAYHSNSPYEDLPTSADNINFASADLITIAYGVNDFKYWDSAIGTISDNNFDTTTFIGGIQYAIEKILNDNVNAKIVLFTPLKCSGYNTPNNVNKVLVDYANAIKLIGEYYSLPVLDLYNISGFNNLTFSNYTLDGLHPNNKGYKFICENNLIKFINNI